MNKFYSYMTSDEEDYFFILKMDFDQMISDIMKVYISKNYLGLFSWLLDRAFCISIA